MNTIRLIDLDTEINVSFQDWMGTGIVKSKDQKKFNSNKLFQKVLQSQIKANEVKTKNVTAYFYAGFAVLMLAIGIFFAVIAFSA